MVESERHRALYHWLRYGKHSQKRVLGLIHVDVSVHSRWAWPKKSRVNQSHMGHLIRSAVIQVGGSHQPAILWIRVWCGGRHHNPNWVYGDVLPEKVVECEQCIVNHRKAMLTESVGR